MLLHATSYKSKCFEWSKIRVYNYLLSSCCYCCCNFFFHFMIVIYWCEWCIHCLVIGFAAWNTTTRAIIYNTCDYIWLLCKGSSRPYTVCQGYFSNKLNLSLIRLFVSGVVIKPTSYHSSSIRDILKEVIRRSSSYMWFTASRCWVKLKASKIKQ